MKLKKPAYRLGSYLAGTEHAGSLAIGLEINPAHVHCLLAEQRPPLLAL